MAIKELKVHNIDAHDIQTRLYSDVQTLPNYRTLSRNNSIVLTAADAEFFSIKTPHGTGYEVKALKNIQLTHITTLSDASHLTNVFSVAFGKSGIFPPDEGEVEIKSPRPGHSG
jgi:hypothetical protein